MPTEDKAQGSPAAAIVAATLVAFVAGLGVIALHQFMAVFAVLIPAAALVLAWCAAAAGYGYAIRRALTRCGDVALAEQAALGIGAMAMLDWLAGWAGLLNFGVLTGVALVGWLLIAWHAWSARRAIRGMLASGGDESDGEAPPPELGARWPIVFCGPAAGMLAAAACVAPGILWSSEFGGYDVLSYHLQLPREWIAAGAIEGREHNAYSYLPNLFEAAYAHLGVWRGSMVDAAFAAQLLHVVTALVAAGALRRVVVDATGDDVAGWFTAGAYLAVPWTLVTGSLAYNEQAVMAMGVAALAIALRLTSRSVDDTRSIWGASVVIGLLVGFAILCKLGAGAMLAAAVMIVMAASRRGGVKRWCERVLPCAIAAGAIVAVWLTRNAMWTGNPTFPMFTGLFGDGHWTAEQAERWTNAHSADGVGIDRIVSQMIAHLQFGYVVWPIALVVAVVSSFGPALVVLQGLWRLRERKNWSKANLVYTFGLLASWYSRPRNQIAVSVGIGFGVMLLMWMLLTHHQSRFLIPLLAPAMVLIGVALSALPRVPRVAAGVALVVTLTAVSGYLYTGIQNGRHAATAPYFIGDPFVLADALGGAPPQNLAAAINELPPDARVYTEAYATPFYARRDVDYRTVWDASPLGAALAEGGPEAAAAWLKQQGYTHLAVDWNMLGRWTQPGNYGYDPKVTPQALFPLTRDHAQMIFAWPDPRQPAQALYVIR